MHLIIARVSTIEQAEKGYSLDDQVEACNQRLTKEGITENIEVLIDDGYSGEFLDRPAINKLHEYLALKIVDSVTFYDPDRMSRNLTNQLVLSDEIENTGARLLFVTGDYDASPEGRLFYSMKGAVSAYEKAKIRERTLRGKRQKANQGKIVFNARPFGYSWDKDNSMYTIDEEQAKVARLMLDLLLNHGMGCRSIALELQHRGIVGPKGSPLSDTTVHKVLSREMYCGTHYLFRQRVKKTGPKSREISNVPKEDWIPIQIPAIFTREEWENAQIQLQKNKRQSRRNCQNEYLLRGVARCAHCHRCLCPTTRSAKRKKTGLKTYSYYNCITKEGGWYALTGERCQFMRIQTKQLDDKVWDIFVSVAKEEKSFTDFLQIIATPNYNNEIKKLTQIYETQLKRHGQVARLIREGLLDAYAAEEELRLANKEMIATKSRLLSIREAQDKLSNTSNNITADEILAAETLQQKRDIILRSGFKIYIIRTQDNHIDITFE